MCCTLRKGGKKNITGTTLINRSDGKLIKKSFCWKRLAFVLQEFKKKNSDSEKNKLQAADFPFDIETEVTTIKPFNLQKNSKWRGSCCGQPVVTLKFVRKR